MKQIKFSKPDITDNDLKKMSQCIKSGWLTHGKNTKDLEEKFSQFTNSKYSITVSSCTAGLHIACLALGFKKGDEVIVPAQTHTATAHAVEFTGAKPIFADVNPITANILVEEVIKKITKKTKGLIVVHMAGFPCDLDELRIVCKKKKIKMIEDCAHALGTTYKSKHAGNFGECGVFSFYPTKQITSGEGGMIVTNNRKLFEKMKLLKAFGIDTQPQNRKLQGLYDVKLLGFNYRMTDFQSSLLLNQLNRYKKNLIKRRKNAAFYINNFKKLNLKYNKSMSGNSYFIFPIILERKSLRNLILRKFKEFKVGASIHYAKSLPRMSYYKNKYKINLNKSINADKFADTNISLPCHHYITFSDILRITKILKKIIEKEN